MKQKTTIIVLSIFGVALVLVVLWLGAFLGFWNTYWGMDKESLKPIIDWNMPQYVIADFDRDGKNELIFNNGCYYSVSLAHNQPEILDQDKCGQMNPDPPFGPEVVENEKVSGVKIITNEDKPWTVVESFAGRRASEGESSPLRIYDRVNGSVRVWEVDLLTRAPHQVSPTLTERLGAIAYFIVNLPFIFL